MMTGTTMAKTSTPSNRYAHRRAPPFLEPVGNDGLAGHQADAGEAHRYDDVDGEVLPQHLDGAGENESEAGNKCAEELHTLYTEP